jgi:ribosomal protein L37AE/L43A
MHIKEFLSRCRRDFYAIYICEHCGATEEKPGYDDKFFHEHAIPGMVCKECGKTAGEDYVPLEPRYPEGMDV